MLKERPLAISSQTEIGLNNSYHNVQTSGNKGAYNMDTANTGSYNTRVYIGDSPGSSSDSRSPDNSSIPTCVVTPTASRKGYISYDEDSLNAYIPSRKQREFIPENKKDSSYWEKRRKNNEAARRSREKRRYHDMALENRIMDLTRDNCKLRNELTAIKKRFGIPLNETFISDEDDPPSTQPPPTTLSPSRTPAQHGMPPAILTSALQQRGPSVQQQNAVRARSYSGSIVMPYQGNYSTSNAPKLSYQPSVSPLDSYYTNSGQRDSSSRHYPVKAEAQDYSITKSVHERDDPIPLTGRSDLTERSAYSSHVPLSMVPQYKSSLPGTNSTSYWAPAADLSSSDSNDEGDWNDQVQEEPLSLVKRNTEDINSSNSDVSNNSSNASNSPTSYSSALPLKLRHKVPQENMSAGFATTPNLPAYTNGLAQLSEIALTRSNLPLTASDDYNVQSSDVDSFRYRSRSLSNPRAAYDTKYVERRRKNNEAARKCRENRKKMTKIREAKSGYLESENSKLKDELTDLQEEMKQLRDLLEKKKQRRSMKDEDKDSGAKEESEPGNLMIETKTEPMDDSDTNLSGHGNV